MANPWTASLASHASTIGGPEYPMTVYGYANAVGIGADPAVLGHTFYSYYTDSLNWQPATVKRLTITTAASATSVVPSSANAGGSAFTLTVNGDHFVKSSTVMWNGSPRATTYVDPSRLTAQILASDISGAGKATVTVSNLAPCAEFPTPSHSRLIEWRVAQVSRFRDVVIGAVSKRVALTSCFCDIGVYSTPIRSCLGSASIRHLNSLT